MFKKFFYACAAVMCLTLAFHFGATSAQGQSGANFRFLGTQGGAILMVSGDNIWQMDGVRGWKLVFSDTPVPASQILCFSNGTFVTTSGEGYIWANEWVPVGPVPGGPTPTIKTSFGALKAKYR